MTDEQILAIKAGDVLLDRGKNPRIVREVSRYFKYGRWHTSVTFVIRRCSWTGRCYTVLGGYDLKQRQFLPTPLRQEAMSYIDKKINYNIINYAGIKTLSCQDVIAQGII